VCPLCVPLSLPWCPLRILRREISSLAAQAVRTGTDTDTMTTDRRERDKGWGCTRGERRSGNRRRPACKWHCSVACGGLTGPAQDPVHPPVAISTHTRLSSLLRNRCSLDSVRLLLLAADRRGAELAGSVGEARRTEARATEQGGGLSERDGEERRERTRRRGTGLDDSEWMGTVSLSSGPHSHSQ